MRRLTKNSVILDGNARKLRDLPPPHVTPSKSPRQLPKDLAATLLTVACAECVLAASGGQSPHRWEAQRYGVVSRRYNSGPKTVGSMARSRSGQFVLSVPRLSEWREDCPQVKLIADSPLWDLLRRPSGHGEALPDLKESADEKAYWSIYQWLHSGLLRDCPLPTDEAQMQRLAACGTLDGIVGLWVLILRALARKETKTALTGGRYLPPALALLACSAAGQRVAHLLFARIRQQTLDALRRGGTALSLRDYDFPAAVISASGIELLNVQRDPRFNRYGNKIASVSQATRAWILEHRAELRRFNDNSWPPWQHGLGPRTHGSGPLNPNALPAFHQLACARIRAELGAYAD